MALNRAKPICSWGYIRYVDVILIVVERESVVHHTQEIVQTTE